MKFNLNCTSNNASGLHFDFVVRKQIIYDMNACRWCNKKKVGEKYI